MIHLIKNAGEAFNLSDYPEGALFFFDFDGVVADQDEEKIFRLPEVPLERNELEMLASLAGIKPSLYPNTGYLRHLIYQAQVFDLPVEVHGEVVSLLWDLHDNGSAFFIVTARSGFYAVDRMMECVRSNCPAPQEVFCLGRAGKADLFAKLRQDWPTRPFVYFEDSRHHIDAALALGDPLMTVVEVQWPSCNAKAEALRKQHLGI